MYLKSDRKKMHKHIIGYLEVYLYSTILVLQDLPSLDKNCLNFPAFFGIRLYFVQNVTQGQIRSCYCPKERRCIEVGGIGSFPLNPTWVWSEKNGSQGKNLKLEKGCKPRFFRFFWQLFLTDPPVWRRGLEMNGFEDLRFS